MAAANSVVVEETGNVVRITSRAKSGGRQFALVPLIGAPVAVFAAVVAAREVGPLGAAPFGMIAALALFFAYALIFGRTVATVSLDGVDVRSNYRPGKTHRVRPTGITFREIRSATRTGGAASWYPVTAMFPDREVVIVDDAGSNAEARRLAIDIAAKARLRPWQPQSPPPSPCNAFVPIVLAALAVAAIGGSVVYAAATHTRAREATSLDVPTRTPLPAPRSGP